MGNSFALCTCTRFSRKEEATIVKHQKAVLRVEKTDGKILEFRAPILVKDLLLSFPRLGVALSKESSCQHHHHLLPLNHELKIGKIYYLLPSSNSAKITTTSSTTTTTTSTSTSASGVSSKADDNEEEQAAPGGIKRIKVIITKQQLQELLSKRISVEEVLAGLDKKTCSSSSSSSALESSVNWKPKLESIPEGIELVHHRSTTVIEAAN